MSIETEDWDGFEIDLTVPGGLKHRSGESVCTLNGTNYYYTWKDGNRYRTHRIIFFLAYGYLPELVDHKDGIRTNNDPSNLRPATISQNAHNMGLKQANTSGVKGLMYNKRVGKWYGQITLNRKRYHTPLTSDKDLCIHQLQELRKSLHGDFARFS